MKEPFSKIELERDDFILSGQKNAKATSVRIIGIDFARLFNQRVGNPLPVPSIPIIGSAIYDPTSSYAMYNVMDANQVMISYFILNMKQKQHAPF